MDPPATADAAASPSPSTSSSLRKRAAALSVNTSPSSSSGRIRERESKARQEAGMERDVEGGGAGSEPMSPAGRLFRETHFNCYIVALLGLGAPVDVAAARAGLEATLVRHPRFSSVQVRSIPTCSIFVPPFAFRPCNLQERNEKARLPIVATAGPVIGEHMPLTRHSSRWAPHGMA
jgi:hypothetical protein